MPFDSHSDKPGRRPRSLSDYTLRHGRNTGAFKFASALRGDGLDFAEILGRLSDENRLLAKPLPEKELRGIAHRACKYPAGRSRDGRRGRPTPAPAPAPAPARPGPKHQPSVNWQKAAEFAERGPAAEAARRRLADQLGVHVSALAALAVGWCDGTDPSREGQRLADLLATNHCGPCWTFPEQDGAGAVVGIRRRLVTPRQDEGGKLVNKLSAAGSTPGLTVPLGGWELREGPTFCPEGASDTAALVSLGLCAAGRPSNTGGLEQLARLFRDYPADRQIVILGERDQKPDGTWPGATCKDVAAKLADRLGRPVYWALPPEGFKDVREWLRAQGLDLEDEEACLAAGRELAAGLLAAAERVDPAAAAQALDARLRQDETTGAAGQAVVDDAARKLLPTDDLERQLIALDTSKVERERIERLLKARIKAKYQRRPGCGVCKGKIALPSGKGVSYKTRCGNNNGCSYCAARNHLDRLIHFSAIIRREPRLKAAELPTAGARKLAERLGRRKLRFAHFRLVGGLSRILCQSKDDADALAPERRNELLDWLRDTLGKLRPSRGRGDKIISASKPWAMVRKREEDHQRKGANDDAAHYDLHVPSYKHLREILTAAGAEINDIDLDRYDKREMACWFILPPQYRNEDAISNLQAWLLCRHTPPGGNLNTPPPPELIFGRKDPQIFSPLDLRQFDEHARPFRDPDDDELDGEVA